MPPQPDVSTRPLIIGGMHRSGTSLTASLFAGAGVDLGPRLLGANASNPMGHFEDLGIQDFHARALVAQGVCSQGFTAMARGAVPPGLHAEARGLLADRTRRGVVWGWKEPRTTLFLDFWQERLPDARHVFVVRPPWDVADSLFRRGDETFILNPTFALDVWTHYNGLILDFVRRHPEHCVVFDIAQVITDPDRVIATVRSRLGVPLGRATSRYRENLFSRDTSATRAALVRTLVPEAWHTYRALRELAGVADEPPATGSRDISVADCAILEWSRASRAETQARSAAEREAHLQAEHAAQLQAEQQARVQAAHEARLQAEHELHLRLQQEARIKAEFKALRRARRPLNRLVRGGRALLEQIAAAARRLLPQAPPAVVDDRPDLRPFPREEDRPATRRAA